MKIKNTKKTNKKIVISTILIVLLAISAVGFAVLNKNNSSDKKSEEKTQEALKKEEEKQDSSKNEENPEKKDEETSTKKEEKPLGNNSDTPSQPTVNQQTQKTIFIVNPSVSVEDGAVRLSAMIDALYVDEGNCRFTLSHASGVEKIYETTILPSPQHKYCAAKEIPVSELGKSGEWKFSVKYENTNLNYEGTSNEKKFTIEL